MNKELATSLTRDFQIDVSIEARRLQNNIFNILHVSLDLELHPAKPSSRESQIKDTVTARSLTRDFPMHFPTEARRHQSNISDPCMVLPT